MTAYAFRISCRTSDDSFPLELAEQALSLPGAPPIVVLARKTEHQTGVGFILWCGGFPSADDARSLGLRVKNAVLLSGLLLSTGIDVGRDEIVSRAAKRANGTQDDRLQPDVHGLQVVPDIEDLRFGFVRFGRRERQAYSPSDFQDKVRESYKVAGRLTRRQELAAQLYAESHFQVSNAARLIMLVSAVESLAEAPSRPAKSLAFIDRVIAEAGKADLDDLDRQSLLSAFGNLRLQSKSGLCKSLVVLHCGGDAAKHFSEAYLSRNRMVHAGVVPPEDDLDVFHLTEIVRPLIVRHIDGSTQSPSSAENLVDAQEMR